LALLLLDVERAGGDVEGGHLRAGTQSYRGRCEGAFHRVLVSLGDIDGASAAFVLVGRRGHDLPGIGDRIHRVAAYDTRVGEDDDRAAGVAAAVLAHGCLQMLDAPDDGRRTRTRSGHAVAAAGVHEPGATHVQGAVLGDTVHGGRDVRIARYRSVAAVIKLGRVGRQHDVVARHL